MWPKTLTQITSSIQRKYTPTVRNKFNVRTVLMVKIQIIVTFIKLSIQTRTRKRWKNNFGRIYKYFSQFSR